MSWFFIALIAPFLYAVTNHIDKILLDKYFKKGGVGTLILFSSLLSVLALPILFWIDPSVVNVNITNIVILFFVGTLNIVVLWCYLLALRDDEASIVIVFYQLVPLFALGLGYIFLHESLSKMQLIAMAIIILGTTIISFEIDAENHFKLRGKTIILMLTASFFWAFESTIFKLVTLEENVVRSLFWEHLVMTLVGLVIFLTIPNYRKQFIEAIKINSKSVLSLNIANECIYMIGNQTAAFAYLLAPIALILLTQSFQPIFVLIIAIVLTLFFPKISVENVEAKHLWQKIIAILITGIGTYLLLSA